MKFTVMGALCLSLAALHSGGCSNDGSREMALQEQPVVKGITVAEVSGAAIPETLEVVGTVRALTSAAILARIPGTVSLLKVREGDRVSKGQLLGRIESMETQAGSAQAQAAIDEAQQGVDEARTRKKLADTTFERYKKLFDEQALTRQEFDVKQAERDLATQGVARAEARLKQLQESGRSATAVADYTKIVAPVSGVVTSKPAALGATVFPGQPLLTIEDEGSYQLDLAVPESLGTTVKPGTPVRVTLDSSAAAIDAKITEVVPTADPASRTFTARVNLTGKGLKSGAFGRAFISKGPGTAGIQISKQALFERGSLTAVWVVDANRIARMRLVKSGRILGDRVEILSGLSAGEKVVTGGGDKVIDGARIELYE